MWRRYLSPLMPYVHTGRPRSLIQSSELPFQTSVPLELACDCWRFGDETHCTNWTMSQSAYHLHWCRFQLRAAFPYFKSKTKVLLGFFATPCWFWADCTNHSHPVKTKHLCLLFALLVTLLPHCKSFKELHCTDLLEEIYHSSPVE